MSRVKVKQSLPRKSHGKRDRTFLVLSALLLLCVASIFVTLWWKNPSRGMPYRDDFASNSSGEWTAVGGSWSVRHGVMRNDSDERGAKLLSGSRYWRNYQMETDVHILGKVGDIGLILRANDEERGVDSYNGYYIGLRSGDSSLVIGRADHGWMEALPISFPGGVLADHWYHLHAAIVGCRIAVAATDLNTNKTAHALFEDSPCVPSGRVGLRSLSTGGEWRNVRVYPATEGDLVSLAGSATKVLHPDIPKSEALYNAVHTFPLYGPIPAAQTKDSPGALQETVIPSIEALRKLNEYSPSLKIAVRGVVVQTVPGLYVQDATGGVAVAATNLPTLNLGDEVEVHGTLEPHDYSTTIRDASIRLLWDRVPMPPMAVTPAQAASGAFDAALIETEGSLVSKQLTGNDTLILTIESGTQSFQALIPEGRGDQLYRTLADRSRLRIRGICVLDQKYTQHRTPFALLLRSADDIDVLAGPPWWTMRHLIEMAFALLVLALVLQFLYSRAERWRLRGILQERERLAHDMHDTLAQSFAGVAFQLQGIRHGLKQNALPDLAKLDRQLDFACDIVRQTHEEASLTIAMLRPESAEMSDLLSSLEQCAKQIVAGGTIAIEVSAQGTARPLPVLTTQALFHIGREAIVNSVRHAHPRCITLMVAYRSDSVEMTITDDGTGFDTSFESRRMGIRGMGKRAKSIGAELDLRSKSEEGTSVRVIAPLAPRRPIFDYLKNKFSLLMTVRGFSSRGMREIAKR